MAKETGHPPIDWDDTSDKSHTSDSEDESLDATWQKEQDDLWETLNREGDEEFTPSLMLQEGGAFKKADDEGIPTFDDLPRILHARNLARQYAGKPPLDIYIGNSRENLSNFIDILRKESIGDVKIGVIYRPYEHSTPILVEKKAGDITLFNTDSVLFDTDDSDTIKSELLDVVKENQPCKLYSLAFDPGLTDIVYRRQYDTYSCAVFSLIDCHKMLKPYFSDFARNHAAPVDTRLLRVINKDFDVKQEDTVHTITALPVEFMKSLQSVKGKQTGQTWERKGLLQLLDENPQLAPIEVSINGEKTTLGNYLQMLVVTGKPNEYIKGKNDAFMRQAAALRESTLSTPADYSVSRLEASQIAALASRQSKETGLNAPASPSAKKKFSETVARAEKPSSTSIRPQDVKEGKNGGKNLRHSV